jgi:hypothetical protein
MSSLLTWSCNRTGVRITPASGAAAFCTGRYEASRSDHSDQHFSPCRDCERGERLHRENKENRNMATKQFKKKCPEHGEFITTGPRGEYPLCKGGKGPLDAGTKHHPKASRVGLVITVDLGRRPELAQRLHEMAEANYRTPELQVLYILDQEYQREKGAH